MFESEKLINRIMFNGASVPLAINTASNDLLAYFTKTLEVLDDSSGVYTSSISGGQFQSQRHLKYVNLPAASGAIGGSAFYGCYSLSRFIMPNCTIIYGSAFYSCSSLESVDFPKCTSLLSYAFCHCSKLSYVNMPLISTLNSATGAFIRCSTLETINAQLVSVLGTDVFNGCSALKNCNIDWSNITSIPNGCFTGCGLERVDIPNVSRMEAYAFSNCRALSEINASNVTGIGYSTFGECVALKSVNFPLLTSLYSNCFNGCTALSSVIVNTSAITTLPSSCFQSCTSLEVVSFPNVASAYQSALFGCSGLKIVNLPNLSYFSNGYQGEPLFAGCESLEEVYLSNWSSSTYYLGLDNKSALRVVNLDNCTVLGYSAFKNCTALTSISVPEVTKLSGDYIFQSCTSLRLISLPKCSYISADDAFDGCSNLSMFVIGTGYSSVCVLNGWRVFTNSPIYYSSYLGYYGSIYVPASLVDAYKTATNWAGYSNRITSIDNLPTT